MLRAIFMIGLFAMLGLFAVGMVFKLFGGILALTFWVVAVALKVLIVGGVLYLVVRLVSPATAERLRVRFSGARLTRYSRSARAHCCISRYSITSTPHHIRN